MRIKFLGATSHVTGSCSWLYDEEYETQFLVDCGMYQGGMVEHQNARKAPFKPEDIDFILLTHAHLDHCGLIPKLVAEGFKGKVYCTDATAKLAKIVMEDAGNLSGLYNKGVVASVNFISVDLDKGFKWGKPIAIKNGISATFLRSSHILGAASISVSWMRDKLNTFLFSGDIGNNTEQVSYLPLMKANMYPFANTDFMLVESTYGGKVRGSEFKSKENRLKALHKVFSKTIFEKTGSVVIPTFSIHRSQEIFIDIINWLYGDEMQSLLTQRMEEREKQAHQRLHILFHSPMMAKAFEIYSKQLVKKITKKNGDTHQYMENNVFRVLNLDDDESIEACFSTYKEDDQYEQRIKLSDHVINIKSKIDKKTKSRYDIVVASSGMCESGCIVKYLDECKNDPKHTIILSGYQPPGGEGEKFKNIAERVESGEMIDDHAEVYDLSSYYSGHADQSVLIDYIFNLNGFEKRNDHITTVFINHGNSQSKDELQKLVEDIASNNDPEKRSVDKVYVPRNIDQWFNLDTREYETFSIETSIEHVDSSDNLAGIHTELKRFNNNFERYLALIEKQ